MIKTILEKAERLVKTDMRYLIKGSFWLTVGQGTSALSAFAASVAFANFVPAQIYGVYKYIISVVSMISNFTITGFATSIVRNAAQNNDGVLDFSVRKGILWSIPATVAGLGVGMYYALQDNYIFGISIFAATLLFNLSSAWVLYGAFLSGKKEFALNTKYHIVTSIATAAALVLTTAFSPGIIQLCIAYFIPGTILNFYFYRRTKRAFVKNNEVHPEYYKESVHFSITNIIAGVAQNLDKIIIFHKLGPVDLAIYNFAIAIPDQLRGLLKSVARLAFPKYAEQDWVNVHRHMRQKTFIFILASLAITALYILIAPVFYTLFFPAYSASVIYSQFTAIGLMGVAGSLSYTALQAHGKMKETYAYIITTSIVQIAVSAFLIIFYGLPGAITSLVFNRFFTAVLSYWLVRRKNSETLSTISESDTSSMQR